MSDTISKFIARDILTDQLEKSVQDLNNKEKFLCSSFHASWFKQCNRRITYKTRDYFLSQSCLENKEHELLREKWFYIFSHCKGLSLIKKNTIAFDKNYKITGETDAVIEMQDSILPVLIKKASGNDYKTVVKQGAFSKDVIELVIYTWLLELKSGILIYDTGNDFHTFHVKKYQPIIESVKKKCLNLIQFQHTNNLPERSYEVRSKECQECEFEKQCWGE